MWPFDRVTQIIDAMCAESNDEVDDYIAAQYLYLMQFSLLYTRLGRNYRYITLTQIIIYLTILVFHLINLGRAAILLLDSSIVIFGMTVHIFLLIQICVCIVIFIQTKHNSVALLHRAIAENFYDYFESYEGINDRLQKYIRRERQFLLMIPILVGIAVCAIMVMKPLVDQYGNFDFSKISSDFNQHLPFPYMVYPYSTEQGFGYYASVVLQLTFAIFVGTTIGIGGFAYIVMSQNLWMQMEILYDSVEHIDKRTEILRSKLFGTNNSSGDKLYDQVQFRNFHIWTDVFSVPIILAYLTGTIIIALSLISLSAWVELPGTTVSALILCACEVGYMYLFSLFSQRLTDLNEKLRFEIYCIKWYLCDNDVKLNLKIFQEVTLRPMTLMAGGLVPANMDTFAKVINSSYSYYNLVTAFDIA